MCYMFSLICCSQADSRRSDMRECNYKAAVARRTCFNNRSKMKQHHRCPQSACSILGCCVLNCDCACLYLRLLVHLLLLSLLFLSFSLSLLLRFPLSRTHSSIVHVKLSKEEKTKAMIVTPHLRWMNE